jgi:hypothetical protein
VKLYTGIEFEVPLILGNMWMWGGQLHALATFAPEKFSVIPIK